MIFFKKKLFKSGNSTAVLFPKELIEQFSNNYNSNQVKISLQDGKIIIERIEKND